jgi:hypothetical protein
MLTAEYGGTGGLAIESGMVVEEPDIEIGAGVSSKGMSQLPQPFPFFFSLLPHLLFWMLVVHNGASFSLSFFFSSQQ